MEFAIILPLLLMLVFGIVQFGIVMNRKQGFHAASREAARVASLPSSTQDDIEEAALDALSGLDVDSTPVISIVPNVTQPCEDRRGETVVVTVAATTSLEIPVFGSRTVDVSGRGEFRCE